MSVVKGIDKAKRKGSTSCFFFFILNVDSILSLKANLKFYMTERKEYNVTIDYLQCNWPIYSSRMIGYSMKDTDNTVIFRPL